MKQLVLFTGLLLLLGCNKDNPDTPTTDAGTAGYVREVRLSDGTRCAVFSGFEKGGIDCEWKEERCSK